MNKKLPANTELPRYRIVPEIGSGTTPTISFTSTLGKFAAVTRDWKITKAWLRRELSGPDGA